jgi:hypothetical protein
MAERSPNRLLLLPVLASALAVLIGGPARAAVYAVVQSSRDEVTVVDPAAVERLPGGDKRRAWTVSVKRNLMTGGPPQPGYVRTFSEYDCSARKVRWKSFSAYSEFGVLVMKKDNADQAWGGSDADAGLRTVCGDIGGASVVAAASLTDLVVGLMRAWDESAPPAPAALDPPKAPPADPKPRKARP